MALTCTPGGASDNSYATLAQANAQFDGTLRDTEWTGYDTADREAALIQATAEIERLGGVKAKPYDPTRPRFPGTPYQRYEVASETYTTLQALHFPRTTDAHPDDTVFIPSQILEGVCEQAFWLLGRRKAPPLVDRGALRAEGVKGFAVDGLSETLGATAVPDGIAPLAWELIDPLVKRASYPTRVR